MALSDPAAVARLQADPARVRNICILAHVDHGKTTLSDSLIATNGIISQKLAGRVRYLDSREDEQLRGITMKSSGISLYFKVVSGAKDAPEPQPAAREFLINLIDSPGHVDFSSEVTAASIVSDGCLVLVDAVEGVCTQTVTVLHAAWKTKLKPILVINKIDRLAHELKLTPLEAYRRMERIVEEANAAVGEFFQGDRSAEATRKWLEKSRSTKNSGDDAAEKEEESVEIQGDAEAGPSDGKDQADDADDDEDLYFDPCRGNVVFASAMDGWAFRTSQFARMYAARLGFKEATLKKFLWGDYYLDAKRKRILGAKHLKGREGLKPLFVQFVLDNIFAVYDAVIMNYNRPKIDKITSALNLKLLPRDLASKDHKFLLQSIFSQWLPLSSAVLLAIVDQLPDPRRAQKERTARILQNASAKEVASDVEAAMEGCTEGEPVVAYVSKMFHVSDDMIGKAKGGNEMTAEDLKERRAEIIRKRQLIEKLEGLSVSESTLAPASAPTPSPVVKIADDRPDAAEGDDEEDEDAIRSGADKQHLIGFARLFSGTISVGDQLYLLGPKYDPRFPHLHRTEITVKGLYLLMGRELHPLPSVKAGNIFGIRGLGTRIVKTGTLSSTLACPSLTPRLGSDRPIVRCAIEARDPRQIKALAKGLRLLNRADPSVEVIQHESGEQVIVAAGELHLERLLKDLKEVFAKGVELRVSDPVVPFRETIAPVPATNAAANMNSLGVKRDDTAAELGQGNESDAAPALASGRRPATESTPTAPLPHGTVIVSTPNKLARLRIRCLPLPLPVLSFLEEEADTIKGIVEAGDRKGAVKKDDVEEIDRDSDEAKRMAAAEKFLEALRAKFAEAVADGAGGPDKDVWSTVVDNIWAFGPKRSGPNILVNHIRGYSRTSWVKAAGSVAVKKKPHMAPAIRALVAAPSGSSIADTAEGSTVADTASNAGQTDEVLSVDYSAREEDADDVDGGLADEIASKAKVLGVKDFDGSITTGFQLSMLAGPLCAETVVGVCIFVEEFKVENLDDEEPSKVAALSGQVISTMQQACRQAFLQWSPRLCLAMYSVQVQATADVLGKVYAVISKRKGRVLSEELQEGTPFFDVTCLLPVVESFGFADDLRKRSSGAANPQLIFAGFETLDLDPFWVPNTEEELEDLGEKADRENIARKYMEQVRKRKGLYVEKKIVEHGEKQRTLKSK